MEEGTKEKKGFFKRFGKLILILSGSIVTLVIVTAVVVVILLSDKTRFSGKIGSDDTVEVIKKNYIEGFKDTNTTGKFTFQIPEEDINSVLNKASKSINNKYVEQIYYGRGDKNHHYFYIDLNLPVITSRVVIDTVAKATDDLEIKLSIEKITLGKINAYSFIKDKGILTSSLFDGFFKSSNVPITFNEKNNTFTVKPLGFIDNFPKVSTISTTFFKLAKEIGSPVIKIEPSILGFTLDFSKFRSSSSLTQHDYSGEVIPNFYDELDVSLENAPSVLVDSDPKTIFSISENDFNIAFSKSIPSAMKEVVTSKLTKNKVTNSLVNIQTNFIDDEDMTLSLVYSFNGYLVDAVVPLTFVNTSEFEAYFEFQYDIKIGKYLQEDIENEYVQFFINNLRAALGAYSATSSLFEFDTDALFISFTDFSSYQTVVQTASKEITLDSEQISFILQKI